MKIERLHVDKISISNPNAPGLDHFSFQLMEGEILGIVGLMDSGIHTLVKFLNGESRLDSGRVLVDEQPVQINTNKQSRSLGIYCVNHIPHLIPDMSVAENLCIIRSDPYFKHYIKQHEIYEITQDLFDDYDITIPPNMLARHLTISQKYALEILKAKLLDAKIVILHDALSSYSENDFYQLQVIMRSMQSNGTAFIIVESKLDRILRLADRLTLVRNGQNAGTFYKEDYDMAILQRILAGQLYNNKFIKTAVSESASWLGVKNLYAGQILRDISFSVRRGEIVGFIDLDNGNFDYLFQILLGQADFDSGEISLGGKVIPAINNLKSIQKAIGYFCKPYLKILLFEKLGVMDNIMLSAKSKFANKIGYIKRRMSRYVFMENYKAMGLATRDFNAKISELTLEQQISINFYKSFIKSASILLVEDPFAGADLLSQQRTYTLLQTAKERNMAILFFSHNISEIQLICDRAYVARNGLIVGELNTDEMKNIDIRKLFNEGNEHF